MEGKQKTSFILLAMAGTIFLGSVSPAFADPPPGTPGTPPTPGAPGTPPPPGAPGLPGATPPAPPAANLHKFPATKRDEAIATARQIAGREDPMQGAFEKIPYPAPWTKIGQAGGRTTLDDEKAEKDKDNKDSANGDKGGAVVPPPPPPSKEKPVPPPPPTMAGGPSGPEDLPVTQLPVAPDKPMVSPNLKLVAILGTKAVLEVPLAMRTANKWPATICLGPGEKFEDPNNGTFSVVSVDPDSVTIEEEQERSVKNLPPIK